MCNHVRHIWSRRDFLFQSGGGISGLALANLLNQDGLLAAPAGGACDAKPVGPTRSRRNRRISRPAPRV